MRRAQALALLLTPLLLGADQAAPNKPEKADWSKVPPDVRALLYTDVKQLPPYPESNENLLDAKLWPKTRVFDGATFVLEYSAHQSDYGKIIRSLSEVDSGWFYEAQYVSYSRKDKSGAPTSRIRSRRGPYYEWYPDGTLYHRSFLASSSYSSYQSWYYDRQGNIRTYDVKVKGSGCNPGKASTQLFGTDGSLVGCTFNFKKWYWMGAEVEQEEYFRLLRIFNKWE